MKDTAKPFAENPAIARLTEEERQRYLERQEERNRKLREHFELMQRPDAGNSTAWASCQCEDFHEIMLEGIEKLSRKLYRLMLENDENVKNRKAFDAVSDGWTNYLEDGEELSDRERLIFWAGAFKIFEYQRTRSLDEIKECLPTKDGIMASVERKDFHKRTRKMEWGDMGDEEDLFE